MEKAQKKTLFILGAGSSASYGFPTGEDLKNLLISNSVDDFYYKIKREKFDKNYYINSNGVIEFYRYLGYVLRDNGLGYKTIILDARKREFISEKEINSFRKIFAESSSISIDTFVSQKKDDVITKVAKVLVSLVIRAFSTDIFNFSSSDDWIGYYIARNLDWNEKFEKELPEIITFNYDNIFYLKLKHNLEHLRGNEKAHEILAKIKIKHVYGNIKPEAYGALIGKDRNEKMENLENFIVENCDKINFVRGAESAPNGIKDMIEGADSIYVLGYGFDRFNNKILFNDDSNFKKIIKNKFISVTGYGIPDYIFNFIKSAKYSDINRNTGFMDEDGKCRISLVRSMPIDMFPNS